MNIKAAFIYHSDELNYRFTEAHPFNQKRLSLTVDLLKHSHALPDQAILAPRMATLEELNLVHSEEYIAAVRGLSENPPNGIWLHQAEKFGLQSEDTPYFTNMHEVTSRVVGGSLSAAEAVMSGEREHALHLGGGLHHALPNKAAGFCVYNDASIVIAYLRNHHHARVLYIDTDVHHGDGVQWTFYSNPDVCTFSIHETGKFLFPGTGSAGERGIDLGFGTSINIPVEPYTEDDSWLECFQTSLCKLIATFSPDVIVSQHGCDAHAFDPLAHIHCSMNIYLQMPKLIHELAHTYCNGRWIALGGGGYDIWRVVPRAWSLLWLTMTDHPLLAAIEGRGDTPLPTSWLQHWQSQSPVPLPTTWLDSMDAWEPMPRRKQITEQNKQMLAIAMLYLTKP